MAEEGVGKSCSRSSCSQKLEFLRVLVPNPFAKLRIPGKIADSLQNEPHKRATLHVPHGKFWHVGLRREGEDLYLDEGWKEFAEALNLRTGYFVLFQYKVNMVFSVKIYDNTMCLKEYVPDSSKKRSIHDLYDDAVRTVGVPPSTRDNIYCSMRSSPKKKTLETSHEKIDGRIDKGSVKAKSISPIFPRFIKIIKSSHSHSDCLWIPEDFCTGHSLVSGCELFLVNSTGKSWPVILSDGKLSGFGDFARDNDLRKGDRCTFQLINANTLLVRVMGSGAEKQHCSPTVQNDSLNKGPEFEREVTRCYLHNMYIPKRIRKSIGLVSDCDVVLMNHEGKSWPVEFFFKANGEGHLGFGWGKFRRENNINMGDRCIFKLVEKNVLVVNKVHEENTDPLCNKIHNPAQVPNEEIATAKHNSPSIILALKAVQKNTSSLCIEKDPCIEAQEQMVQSATNRLSSTGIVRVPVNDQENSIIVHVEKTQCSEAQKEKLQNNNPSSSTGTTASESKKKLITVCVERTPCIVAQKEIGWNNFDVSNMTNIGGEPIVKPCTEAQEQMVGSSSIGIEGIPSIDYVEKAPSSKSQNKNLQNSNSSISTATESSEAQMKMITVCVEKTPRIISRKEVGQNNSDILSMSGIEDEPTVEQKKSSSFCVTATPPSDAQKEKVEKRRSSRLPCLEKRTLFEMQKGQQKMDDWGSMRFPKIEKIIVPYNVNRNKMVLSKEFCKRADLCTPRSIILKDSESKTWRVNYNPNDGRGCLRWEKFVNDKKLKVGDKCIFKLVAHDTLLINVVRK